MAASLQVFDATGRRVFYEGDRLGRVLGFISVSAGVAGSLVDAGFNNGTPFYGFFHYTNSVAILRNPNVSVSGTTLSWDFAGNTTASCAGGSIVYGIY